MSIKKKTTVFLMLIVTVFMLLFQSGCSMLIDTENKNHLELGKDGTITQIIVDDSYGDITGEKLENYINESISAFNMSGESISLEKCRVKNDKINITLKYSSVKAYAAFNNVNCFNGTVKEAFDAGYNFNRNFYVVNGAEVPYVELVSLCTDCLILIIEEPVTVTLPGDLYIRTDGITMDGSRNITVEANTDTSLPELFQTRTIEPVFMIYKAE